MNVYERLRQLCDARGISINTMEKEAGLSSGISAKWKESMPNTAAVMKLAEYFEVSADYILGMKEIQKNNSVVADATLKMIYDPELTSVVEKVSKLNEKQLVALKALLDAFLD